MTGPLAGLRVVELGGEISVPYCTKLLVDLGADVHKFEPPSGDPLRCWGPFPDGKPDVDRSGLFEYLNAGKRVTSVDFASQAGRELIREAIAGADLLVYELPQQGLGEPSECGLDEAGLARLNPTLVAVRLSAFGRDGARRDRQSTPLTMQAASGWISVREPGRPPVQAGGRLPEYVAGAYSAMAALTALRITPGANRVVEVDVSVLETLLSTLPYPMLMAERAKRAGRPTNSKAAPMLGIVRVSDGFIGINCLTGQHWLDVCAMMGLPEFGEQQLAIMLGGPERDEFFAKAQPWLDAMTVADLVELSQAMRIPAAPVSDGASILSCPQFVERGFFVEGGQRDWRFLRPGAPFRLSKTPAAAPSLAPAHDAAAITWDEPRVTIETRSEAAPFAGLKVFDLSTFWAGAYLTCYLGAHGADVIKVESIQRPDGFRYSGAFPSDGEDWYERSLMWQATNLNKRDITLELTSQAGRELALRLAAEADVVVENFSPRVVEHFGLDYDSLAELNPGLIMVRMPGFGLAGPWRDYVGWALNIEQLSGMSAATGYPDGPPCNVQGPADPIAGVHAAVALLAALEHRRRTGEGQLIEVAQVEVGAAVMAEPVIEYSVTGTVRERTGNRHPVYSQGVYPTGAENDWVAISVRDDTDWAAVTDVIGREELRSDPRFASAEHRLANQDAFDEQLAGWTRTRSAGDVVEALATRGVPAERLLVPDRMYDVDETEERGFYQELDHPVTGAHRFPGWPFRVAPESPHHRTAAPTLGQHNAEVFASLGLSDDELETLRAQGIIGTRPLNA